MPVKDNAGKIIKYIGARYHIEDDAIALALYNAQAKALGMSLLQENTAVVG